jgi:hypothetical protein
MKNTNLIVKDFQKGIQQFICVIDAVSILANDPDHASLGFGLVKGVQILTQGGDNTFVPCETRQ